MSDEVRRRIRRSQKQERDGMAKVGGKRHSGSGNQPMRKGDGRSELNGVKELHEFKRTDKKQITLKSNDLEKVCDEALAEGGRPVFRIELNGRSYVLLEENDYIELRWEAER